MSDDGIVFVCVIEPVMSSDATTCSKCGVFCFYTQRALEYAKKKYKGKAMRFECERCAALMMTKQTDAEIRQAGEAARQTLPPALQWMVDEVDPERMRSHFRRKVPQ